MKIKIRNGTKNVAIGFLAMSMVFVLLVNHSNAAGEVCKVTFCLNGGTMTGITELQTLDLPVGSSYTMPKPVKPGYDFMGWIQQGAEILSPMGSIRGTHALNPSDYDGEFTNPSVRPSNFLQGYCATVGLSETNMQKTADCQTHVGTYMHRVSITQNAQQSGLYERIGVSNLAPRTWVANTTYRVTMYVKIPKGYSLAHHWWFPDTCNGAGYVNGSSNKPFGSYLDVQGNDEFQLIEFLWNSGSMTTPYGSPALVFTQTNPSLPQPSASNPINFDFGYFSYSIANGSIGASFQNSSTSTTSITALTTGWNALTAIWEPSTYNITYDANGGSGVFTNSLYRYNTTNSISLSNVVPTRQGYTFLGWSTNKNATTSQYAPGQTYACSNIGNKTLYAIWKFTAGGIIKSPKTLTLDATTGKCTFKIESTVVSGTINVTVQNTINFNSTNKNVKTGTINLSSTYLNPSSKTIIGTVSIPSLTAGSWNSAFNIHYSYVP